MYITWEIDVAVKGKCKAFCVVEDKAFLDLLALMHKESD